MIIWSSEIKELEKLFESLKGHFPDLEKELEQLVKTEDSNVVLLYSRRCLEVIITDLCQYELKRPRKTEPLKGIIDKLNREEKVPSYIITSMDNLNSLSTYGAHPKDFDPEQVKPALNNLSIIIKWYLKYKDKRTFDKAEEAIQESKEPISNKEGVKKSKKSLIFWLSGLILVVAIVVVTLLVFKIPGGKRQTKELEKSIAVLPFLNDSPDEENTYFINGIMDEILVNLQTIKELRVISRTSVEKYRDSDKSSIPEIARELGVNYIVEGSGQKYGNTFSLRVQLIRAAKESHLWAESYEQEIKNVDDILSIQRNIAESIATELKAIITPEEKQLIEKIPTTNLTAYDLFLKGNQEYWSYWSKGNLDHIYKSMDYLRKSIELDPEYSLAYTGLGRNYWMLGHFDPKPSPDYWEESRRLLNKAISLDPENGWAYANLGVVQHNWDWDSIKARRSFEKAILLSPENEDVYVHYFWFEKRLGNCDKAASLLLEWKKIAPALDTDKNFALLYCQNHFQQIVDIFSQTDIEDLAVSDFFIIISAHSITGNFTKALEVAEYMIELGGDPSWGLSYKGIVLAMMGKEKEARMVLSQIDILSESRKVNSCFIAGIYAALGENDKAREYLEKSLREREFMLHEILTIPPFYLLKDEPWVQDIIRRSWIPLKNTD